MKVTLGTVTVSFGSGESARELSKPTQYTEVETSDDVLSLLQNSDMAKEVIASYNYGANLRARSKVRATILETEGGPDKAVDKMVKDMVKARAVLGRPITEDEARKVVLAMLG